MSKDKARVTVLTFETEADAAKAQELVNDLFAKIDALEAQLAECVAALEFYAASNGLCDNEEVLYINGEVDLIAGKRAREVLAKVKK